LFENINDNYRKMIHVCLDEWLDHSGGRGIFYIGEENYKIEIK